jgi:ABC-2 type transport system permease protein
MWSRIVSLIVKELLAIWRDPKSRIILIMPPTIEMCVLAFAATQEVKNVPIAVLNQDSGIHARDLVARFTGSAQFTHVQFLDSEPEIAPAIDSRQVLMVLHIRDDFSRQIVADKPASVQLIFDGRRSNAAQIVAGYAQQIVENYNAEITQYQQRSLAGRKGAVANPVSLVMPRIWFNPNLDPLWNTVPALIAIITTLMGLLVTALSVARERELGTFEQLLVSPLSAAEIIVGKTIPALLIGVVEATVMILTAVFAFGLPLWGSVPLLYASMLVYLFAVIGVGLFISSLAKTQQQAVLGAFVFMVPAIMLSGFASPVENMPDWLQTVTLINPIRYYIVIVKGIFLKDMPASVVAENLWPMGLIATFTLSTATWLFRHRME